MEEETLCADRLQDSGVFLIDKPEGLSSFAIVRKTRSLLGIKKVGHAGTLDPFATGLLIVCAGRSATRCIEYFMAGPKTYLARLQLGMETDTQDPEGKLIRTTPVPALDDSRIEDCLRQHRGVQLQIPPFYSAAKHKGKSLYTYARRGIHIEKPGKPIEIYTLLARRYDPCQHTLDIELCCSRGTYVRVLAADIGRSLGCGAYLTCLRRTNSGIFSVDESLPGSFLFGRGGIDLLRASRRDIKDILPHVQHVAL